jgi:adenylylsulfate kinase-like enzyme
VKARAGELTGFTGVDDPYEAPLQPELVIASATTEPAAAADAILAVLDAAGVEPGSPDRRG